MVQILNIIATRDRTNVETKDWATWTSQNYWVLEGCVMLDPMVACHVTLVKNPMIQIVVTNLRVVAMKTQRGSFLPYNPMSLNQSLFFNMLVQSIIQDA